MARRLALDTFVLACTQRAADYRLRAAGATPTEAAGLLVQADAVEKLADDMRQGALGFPPTDASAEELARAIAPTTFEKVDAMVRRLRDEGKDEAFATSAAEAAYAAELSDARKTAGDRVEEANPDKASYWAGVDQGALWHERHAAITIALLARETDSARKAALQQRADRHRLYAEQMRQDASNQKAIEDRHVAENRQREEKLVEHAWDFKHQMLDSMGLQENF